MYFAFIRFSRTRIYYKIYVGAIKFVLGPLTYNKDTLLKICIEKAEHVRTSLLIYRFILIFI